MKHTISSIKQSKCKKQLVMITAYDTLFAKLFNKQVDMILIGDSLNMSFNGKNDTISATLKQMIYHTKAVCKGANETFTICDMPFGTYTNKKQALKNCTKVYQKTNVDSIKIEGGVKVAKTIKYLTSHSIAVVGHIGLMPQSVRFEGGYKVKGKDKNSIKQLIKDAKALEKAGAFLIIVEGVKAEQTKLITDSIAVPIVGIGAGGDTDGQVLVWSDMLGFFDEFRPKFVRRYLDGAKLVKDAIKQFASDIESKAFPNKDESY